MFRVVFMTFGGEYRGGGDPEAHGKPHESPPVMVMPDGGAGSTGGVSGLWNVTGDFGAFMGHGETHSFAEGFFGIFTHSLPWISLIVAGLGILLAYAIYSARWLSAERIGSMFKPLYTLFLHKYWLDELYENVIVSKVLLKGLFAGLQGFDSYVRRRRRQRRRQRRLWPPARLIRARPTDGQLQLYGLFIGIGISGQLSPGGCISWLKDC